MFNRNKHSLEDNRGRLEEAFKELVAGAEGLLQSTSDYSQDEMHGARNRLKRQLANARTMARDWEDVALDRTGRAARAADAYVHDNAWKSLGIVAVAGIAIGCIVAAACMGDRRY